MTPPPTQGEVARLYKGYVPQIKQTGSQWRRPCLIHRGTNPSFSVDPETGAWHCHSKCGRGGSLVELQRILGAEVERATRQQGRKIVATYDYSDEGGTLLFECVRYEPKRFSQRRPDGQGGWINNLQGVRRQLFRLPILRDATTVLIAEGEKDVLKLVGLSLVATCNPMGAGKWQFGIQRRNRGSTRSTGCAVPGRYSGVRADCQGAER